MLTYLKALLSSLSIKDYLFSFLAIIIILYILFLKYQIYNYSNENKELKNENAGMKTSISIYKDNILQLKNDLNFTINQYENEKMYLEKSYESIIIFDKESLEQKTVIKQNIDNNSSYKELFNDLKNINDQELVKWKKYYY